MQRHDGKTHESARGSRVPKGRAKSSTGRTAGESAARAGAIPGRIEYGAPPGYAPFVDEPGMRGQPDYGRHFGPLSGGPTYPVSDSPWTAPPPVGVDSVPLSRDLSDVGREHRGKGPRDYVRSDVRIREDVCDRLTEAPLDASDVVVEVRSGDVILDGTVLDKRSKRLAEDIAEETRGVKSVENHLRIASH